MDIRLARPEDLSAIMAIIASAQAYLKAQGLDQWQNGYPSQAQILSDINAGNSWLLPDSAGQPAVTAALIIGIEPDYQHIEDGAWGSTGACIVGKHTDAVNDYAAIHRVAIRADLRGSGLAAQMMAQLEQRCRGLAVPAIRIDTHPGNLPMQRFLQKLGFTRRGIIRLSTGGGEAGAIRVAFDKLLTDAPA